jgi:outer membrane protein assembly factor BamB
MRRRTALALIALGVVVAGCAVSPVTHKPDPRARGAADTEAPATHAGSPTRFELVDHATLPGEPGGFAADREGAIVEVDDENVVALDTQGDQRWSTPLVGASLGWPWLADGVAVIPTLSDDALTRLDAGPGGCVGLDRATGAVRWSHEEVGRSGVAVSGLGATAYCVFDDGTMVAIDVDRGDVVWRAQLDPGAPVGRIEVSERTAVVVDEASQRLAFTMRVDDHWFLDVRDLATGADRGGVKLQPIRPSSALVAIGPGRVAFGNGAEQVCEMDLRKMWVTACVNNVPAPEGFDPASIPVATEGLIVVAALDGSVSAVDLAHGKVRWSRKLDTRFLDTQPVVSDGVVLIADGIRTIWALRVSDGSRVPIPKTDDFVISSAADPAGGAVLALRGNPSGRLQRLLPTG